jgi:hypothetical protein
LLEDPATCAAVSGWSGHLGRDDKVRLFFRECISSKKKFVLFVDLCFDSQHNVLKNRKYASEGSEVM